MAVPKLTVPGDSPEALPIVPGNGGDKPQGFAGTGGPSVGFTPALVRTGTEILVNTATAGGQYSPQILALSNGGFVVVWYDYSFGVGGATGDSEGSAFKAQVFTAAGAMTGPEILVNTATAGDQYGPEMTALSNGGNWRRS